MNATLVYLGTAAGALIAIGTVLRWAIRRTARTAVWLLALSQLPAAVADLRTTVADLSRAVDGLQHHTHPAMESL